MELIKLGGREWRIVQTSTLQQVIWMDRQIAETGVASLLQRAPVGANWSEQIWAQISKSDKTFPLLSGMLLPREISDEDWTPEVAEKTAAFLKKLTAPEDHAAVRSLLISVVLGFFGAAQRYAELSAIALAAPAAPPAPVQ
jgi:hypothetical protein